MFKNITLLISGIFLAISLIIPPSIGKVSIFEYSDIPILFLFFILLFSNFFQIYNRGLILRSVSFSSKTKDNFPWIFLITLLAIFYLFFNGNTTSLRLILYISIGLLIKNLLSDLRMKDVEIFFFPLIIVYSINFIAFSLNLSFLNNSIGWITNYSDSVNLFFSGRLSGFQGSGPNVAGTIFGIFVILNFYFLQITKRRYYFFATILNLFLFFITYSRGSYVAFLLVSLLFILLNLKSRQTKIFYVLGILISVFALLYLGPSSYILKENDRSLLANIAVSNIQLTSGVGGGKYVEKIYEPYLLSVNPELLEENLKISLNKVELGITPEEYRNSSINFFIGTSGGGYEVLQQYFIAKPCSDDRNTCQYLRVDSNTLVKFFTIFNIDEIQIENSMNDQCGINQDALITRANFACLAHILNIIKSNSASFEFTDLANDSLNADYFSYLKSSNLFVECEESKKYACPNRPLAIGELSVIVESLFISDNILPQSNLELLCDECKFRDIDGFIKIKYDRYDSILPRSKITFYTSNNGVEWKVVGYPHYTGEVIDLNFNRGLIEIGGYADGQSFGNTFLDSTIKSISIQDNDKLQKIVFSKEYLDIDYYVFKPSTLSNYNSKITFQDGGIKLFNPNKYWLAIENNYNFNDDFEIVIELILPEIPWETQTLVSNTSSFTEDIQSWKVNIDDGRLLFQWTNDDGEYVNQVGDFSLRSGVLVQKSGKIDNEKPPLVSTSYLSQLTTAHNGYLTFFVEFGLFQGLLFFSFLIFLVFRNYKFSFHHDLLLITLGLIFYLIHNFTNDLIYSPDATIIFVILLGLKDAFIRQEDFEL